MNRFKIFLWLDAAILLSIAPIHVQAQEPEFDETIARQFRRFGGGLRGGVTLDPEMVNVGIHGTFGPFFDESIAARPNVEASFGEITTMVAVNLEGVYFFPFENTADRRFYAGGGIGLNFIDRGIDEPDIVDDGFLDDFDYETGLNVLGGVEWRSGTFLELKGTAYGGAGLRVTIGHTF